MADNGSAARLRWSVVRALFDPGIEHEQAGIRLALVISNDSFNRYSDLVTVVPLTTARRAPLWSEVLIPADAAGLAADSLALTYHMRTISRARFRRSRYGRLTDPALRRAVAVAVLDHFDFDDLDALGAEP